MMGGCHHPSKAIKVRKKKKQDKNERRRNKERFSLPYEADNSALIF
jgi:hypothetical protein